MNNIMYVQESFDENWREELINLLEYIGDDINFNDDNWCCYKLKKNTVEVKNKMTIYFSNTPEPYKEWIRYYALVMASNGNTIKTIINNVTDIKTFFQFLHKYYNDIELEKVDTTIMINYQKYLINQDKLSEDTKHSKWSSVSNFYLKMKGADEKFITNPVMNNIFIKKRNDSSKYIPEFVTNQLDDVFKDENIPLHFRTFYWIARFIPIRLTEVIDLELDFIKKIKDGWVLTLPMWKQNDGNYKPQLRVIRINNNSKEGDFLIDLILKQKEESLKLQDKLPEQSRGYLFTAKRRFFIKKDNKISYGEYKDTIDVACKYSFSKFLNSFCKRFNIVNENGKIYHFTSHYLRHNGITDRLSEGFETVDIRAITSQRDDSMILNNYNHVDKDSTIRAQEKLIEKKEVIKKDTVYFKGRILNMNESMQDRLLRNMRAHKLKYGICSDISNCKNKYDCLSCSFFIPDVADLEYYEHEVEQWTKKVEFFSKQNSKLMKENAEYNLELNKNIVDRINKNI